MNVNMADYLIPKEIYDELFSDYIELVQREEHLQQENQQLKDRINKALDFINAWKEEKVFKVSMIDLMQIEDFLKGDKE